jgi:hypothetical protein
MVFIGLRNTSADDLAVFVFDLENESFFIRVNLVRNDLNDLPADPGGFFPCKVLDPVFHNIHLRRSRFAVFGQTGNYDT